MGQYGRAACYGLKRRAQLGSDWPLYDLRSRKISTGPSLERIVASELRIDTERARSFYWPSGTSVRFALSGWDNTDKSLVVLATVSLVEKTGAVRFRRSCWMVDVLSGYARRVAVLGGDLPILPQQVVSTVGGIAAVAPPGVMQFRCFGNLFPKRTGPTSSGDSREVRLM